METPGTFEGLRQRVARSTTLKMISIGILILVLLIPSAMIASLLSERKAACAGAVAEISSKWGGDQILGGPILSVPYRTRWQDDKGVTHSDRRVAYFLPEDLEVEGTLTPEIRYRGIYQAVLYTAHLEVRGAFARPDFARWEIADRDVLWREAVLFLGITDLKGIKEGVRLNWAGAACEFTPGLEMSQEIKAPVAVSPSPDRKSWERDYRLPVGNDQVFRSGISVPLALAEKPGDSYAYAFALELAGSDRLGFLPLGKETRLKLASSWPSPSFDGEFLPVARTVSGQGFAAEWKVLHFNRNIPQQWQGARDLTPARFGVRLILPADGYQMTTRAAKYDVLFICLTFLLFFFVEILSRRRLHPIQYLMVGLAISLFYVLLLSFSEHLSFTIAYLIASLGIVLLLTGYTHGVLANRRTTLSVAIFTSGLYAFLYTVLRLEDYALLIGSLLLFSALAVVMYLSRKIDWYAL